MKTALKNIIKYFPIALIIGTYLWSVISISIHSKNTPETDEIIIRIGHWQLEPGVREAFDKLLVEYQKIHPKVQIIQDAIPSTTYGQWVSTQLMGGTAPDIIQVGGGLPSPIWLSYFNRYFLRLTSNVCKPNPYNKGTELEKKPLRLTYKDGMLSGYNSEMQEYVGVPLSIASVRICYNKDLLKKLCALKKEPADYRSFLQCCREIKSKKDKHGKFYTPIAASKYHFDMWDKALFEPITYSALKKADFNRDGLLGNNEQYVAIKSGILDFNYPAYKAMFQMIREITDNFQPGYTGLQRDEAVFLFAQQKAVFMAAGTWDIKGIREQAKGKFEMGIMDFPLPAKEDPVYGRFVEGPRYERLATGFVFGVTKESKHPEEALDFLLFLASKRGNEKLNKIIGWIPAIIGTSPAPGLEIFEPSTEGVYGAINLYLGGETWIKWLQLLDLYKINKLSYEELAGQFLPFYKERGYVDFIEQSKDWKRGVEKTERFIAGFRGLMLTGAPQEAKTAGIKYRKLISTLLSREISRAKLAASIKNNIKPNKYGPYEYKPEVLEKVRKNLAKSHTEK